MEKVMTAEYSEFLPFLHHHKRFVRRQQKESLKIQVVCWMAERKRAKRGTSLASCSRFAD
jgi:hypothetical protein